MAIRNKGSNYKNYKLNQKAKPTILNRHHTYLTWLADNLKVNRAHITPILRYCDKLKTILNTRGKPDVLKYNKSNRLNFIKFLFNLNPEFETVENLVSPVRSLRPIYRAIKEAKSYNLVRLYLSGLYITRGIRLIGKPSFESIERKPSHEDPFFDRYEKRFFYFLKNKLGVNPKHMGKPTMATKWREYHMSSKSGPNGHALWSSFEDNNIMPTHLAQCIYYIGGPRLEANMHALRRLYRYIPGFFERLLPRKRTSSLRRISLVHDKEGKTREIAIGDYWSQACLKPLHKYLYKLLSRIPQDCTHDQGKLLGKLIPTEGSSFHSIDLSNATDRFPIRVEYLLLKILFGTDFACCWKHIMVHIPFDYNRYRIKYATGNPMGMYTSWATFAVCHHFVVYLASLEAKIKWEKVPYMILGDDIVIADDAVAYHYKRILSEWDIPFSPEKTHTSPHGYEFAKQIILHGKNVSPLPFAALFERRNSPIESVGILLNELWSKDWSLPIDDVLESYYLRVVRWPKNKFLAYKPKLKLVTSLLAYFKGLSNLDTYIYEYVVDWTKKEWDVRPVILKAYARWLSVKTVQHLFLESRDRVTDYSNKLPLGFLAEQLVIAITSIETSVDPFEYIQSVPFLQVYGKAEETYIRLQGDLNDKGLGGNTDIRKYIGKVDIPLSDRDFYVRHRDVLIIRALKSSRILEDLIRKTPQVVTWTGKAEFTLPWYEFICTKEDLLPCRR